ncbi:MAG: DNA internalization-related competence protein ComEC/Rec2 [Nitrospirae bacterium]|nr:DNA internalization-related competence protein ComEC/Rec2 [Nitrospirota bacterium]
MIGIAVSFITGIAAYNLFPFFPFSIITLFITAVIFLLLKQRENKKKIFLTIFVFIFGFIHSSFRHETLPEIKLPEKEVSVEGTVIDVPEISGEKLRFTIDNVYINRQHVKGKVKLSAEPEILEYLSPAYGDRIKTFTKLNEPITFLNPDVYSYNFKKDGLIANGYIKQIEVTGKGRGLLSWLYSKRQRLGEIIDNSLSEESAGFLKAIILGLQKGITPETRDAFSATGLAHLLSISGTHFGLLAFIFFKVIKAAIKSLPIRILTRMTLYVTPTQIAVVLTLPVLVLYTMISGASTPAIRSFIMVLIYMTALFLGRKGQWLNSLAIAAIIILLWQPDSLFDLSFQLSFLAVLSIGFAIENKSEHKIHAQEHKHLIKKTFDGIKTSMLMTLAAVIVTAPIVIYYFYQFPLISPVSNLIITPLVCFIILPFGFFTVFFALLFNMDFMPLSYLTDSVTRFALKLIKIASQIPHSNLHLHKPSIIVVILFFFSFAFAIKSKSKWKLLPFVLVLCIYLMVPFFSDDDIRITFLDVGQGDASVIHLPDKRIMLIDGGAEDYDTGRRVIAPYLWSNGIKKIDYLVLSHPHPDHYGGLIYITDNFKISEVWLNGRAVPEAKKFFWKIQERKIPYRILKRGDMLEGKGYRIYALHPYNQFYAGSPRGEFSNENNNSLVLKIEFANFTALLAGDIEIEAEENLSHLGRWLKSDIIKVPHHGGRTSSSEEFLKTVNPKIAIVSAGRNNPFNHPHAETLYKYRMTGARFLRTDREGAVSIALKNKKYVTRTYRDSKFMEVRRLRDEMKNLRLLL